MINIMINIKYVITYAACAYTLANADVFDVFMAYLKVLLGISKKKPSGFWQKLWFFLSFLYSSSLCMT